MADQQVGNVHGFAASHTGSGQQMTNMSGINTSQRDGYVDVDLMDIAAMRTRLAAISPTRYTDEYLNMMTANDMAYAIRLNDNPTTIK